MCKHIPGRKFNLKGEVNRKQTEEVCQKNEVLRSNVDSDSCAVVDGSFLAVKGNYDMG